MVARTMLVAGWLVAGALAAVGAEPEADATLPESPSPQAIAALVEQLGSSTFAERESAAEQLSRIGMPAHAALVEAQDDADAEVRDRAHRILAVIDRADLERRIADFVADTGGQLEHDLPGWERFRTQVGQDRPARELFANMLRAEPKLLAADEAEERERLFAEQLQLTQQQLVLSRTDRHQPPVPEEALAALVFMASEPGLKFDDKLTTRFYSFLHQSGFLKTMRDSGSGNLSRKLLGMWIRRGGDGLACQYALNLALQFNFREEGLALAEELIEAAGAHENPPQNALVVIGRFGSTKHLELLEPMLDNKSVLSTNQVGKGKIIQCQVCDLALGVMVGLTKQNPADYGFKYLQKNAAPMNNIAALGFLDDAPRDEAIAKWRAWRIEHPAREK